MIVCIYIFADNSLLFQFALLIYFLKWKFLLLLGHRKDELILIKGEGFLGSKGKTIKLVEEIEG